MQKINQKYTFDDLIEILSHRYALLKYFFLKKAISFPIVFHIQTINSCNSSCSMCPYSTKKPEKIEKISKELFEKIIKEISLHSSGYKYIHLYLQNEPLLDKDLFRKLKFIKNESNNNITTGITTNGSLLTPDKIPDLISSDIDELVISLDAFKKETYSKIRVSLDFDAVKNNIDAIINSEYQNGIFVEFTKQKENISEFNDFIKHWKNKGLPILIFTINNRGGGVDSFDKCYLDIQKNTFSKKFKEYMLENIIKCCPLVLSTFNIRSNGDVILCCNDYSDDMILGNLNDSTIKDIWNSEQYKKIRKQLLHKKYDEILPCSRCSLWH